MFAKLNSNPEAPAKVLSTALVRAAERLGLTGSEVATILGVSPATVSRLKSGTYVLREKEIEIAAHLVRLYRSLSALTSGEDRVAQQWMRNPNSALNAVPADFIKTLLGLINCVAYLDSRRTVV